ncbi:MAG TPA: histidine phosphatase family protein [Candidatus Elarobacter sp.]|jgi:broad specificity phosphatase PhoE|nr:histidine phosphatase family protein [Candidatus Elarobacter sp.]
MDVACPSELRLIRHAESAGNIARAAALASGAAVIDIAQRDCDVPLSELGERQAAALGTWWARNLRPFDVVLCSPYVRAQETTALGLRAAGWDVPVVVDERLREKEFGLLDRLTRSGIEARFPEQAELRRRLGKFYYRPPGGESWTDVILRLRSAYDDLRAQYDGRSVAIVSHQVIVLCFRYILEALDEKALLAIDRAADVANCAVTTYVADHAHPGALALASYNVVAPVEEAGETVTARPDAPVARG